jgi:pyrroloquinoline-quinone synthase
MLDHPFYRAWMAGEVTPATLAAYHRSYHDLIRRVPEYWQRVIHAFRPEFPGEHPVVSEERRHIRLWEQWGERMAPPADFPRLNNLTDALDSMTPSQLLGALQSFESQQPEVARTKKEGLIRHYGFSEGELAYFDEHQNEEGHIRFGRELAGRHADREEFKEGFTRGSELLYASLDSFQAR